MDDLISLIETVVDRKISDGNIIKSFPGKVVEVYENGNAKVSLVSNGANYIIPNYSGSAVDVGENVKVYSKAQILSNNNSYIGASPVKEGLSAVINVLECENNIGEIFETNRVVANTGFTALKQTWCFIVINAVVLGVESAIVTFGIELNGTEFSFQLKESLSASETKTLSCVVPYLAAANDYTLEIKANGTGTITALNCFVYGQGIIKYDPYEPTTDSDYIYSTTDDGTDIIYYIGTSTSPEIPRTINNKPVTTLYATSFNYSNVERVYLPDGVTEIE